MSASLNGFKREYFLLFRLKKNHIDYKLHHIGIDLKRAHNAGKDAKVLNSSAFILILRVTMIWRVHKPEILKDYWIPVQVQKKQSKYY